MEETKRLFPDADFVVMDALVRVCQEKIDMLKKAGEEESMKFDMKAYNALEVKENALKAMLTQFMSAREYLMRM